MAKVQVGTPPQSVLLTVDTGSSDTWVIDSTDPFCGDTDENDCIDWDYGMFNHSKSCTYKLLNYAFNITYSDLSFGYGVYASESVSIAGFRPQGIHSGGCNQ